MSCEMSLYSVLFLILEHFITENKQKSMHVHRKKKSCQVSHHGRV